MGKLHDYREKIRESFVDYSLEWIWGLVFSVIVATTLSSWNQLATEWQYLFVGAFCSLLLFGILVWSAKAYTSAVIRIKLTPSSGPGTYVFLGVRNLGDPKEFWAHAQIIGAKNTGGQYVQREFELRWDGTGEKKKLIHREEPANLAIARWSKNDLHRLAEMHIVCRSGDGEGSVDSARWNLGLNEPLPQFALEISIFAEGARCPVRTLLFVQPREEHGPIEIVSIGYG